MSPTVTLIGAVAMSSLVVTFATFEMVGASLALVTVTTNMSVTDSPVLLWNVTPIRAVPDRFATGVTVTERMVPLPPKTMLPRGTSVSFDEVLVSGAHPACGSFTSPIVKGSGPVVPSSGIVWLAMSEIVGAVTGTASGTILRMWPENVARYSSPAGRGRTTRGCRALPVRSCAPAR